MNLEKLHGLGSTDDRSRITAEVETGDCDLYEQDYVTVCSYVTTC